MPTAESVSVFAAHRQQGLPPPPHSPPRDASMDVAAANLTALVANSSMDADDFSDGGGSGGDESLSSPADERRNRAETEPDAESHDGDDDDDGEVDVAIGQLSQKLDPDEGRCWSCLVDLRGRGGAPEEDDDGAGGGGVDARCPYATHEHPLLRFAVCSVCEERAEAVEGDVIDAELGGTGTGGGNASSDGDAEDGTTNACSWCGLEDDELGHNDDRDDVPMSDLLLCDKCPRGFCVRCAVLSLGGDVGAWEKVREAMRSDQEWACPKCSPTEFLERLRRAYDRMSCASPETIAIDVDEEEEGESNDEHVQGLLEQLDRAEHGLEDAARKLEESHLERERGRLESDFVNDGVDLEELEGLVRHELGRHERRCRERYDRLTDTISRLQEELDSRDAGLMEAYYKCRAKERGGGSGGGREGDDAALVDYKISADLALERRDAREGFSKGEFRGASGYKPRDPGVLKLEPEDLDATHLNEIEDVNTLEGAMEVMRKNAGERVASAVGDSTEMKNTWRSRTGTTELDIEMFRKKAVRFEEVNLGDKIDLDLLEKRAINDDDDAVATEKADSMKAVRRRGAAGTTGGLVVKRSESLRSLKKQARREADKSRLSGRQAEEYEPRLPPADADADRMPATMPRSKKRAQLQRMSAGAGGAIGGGGGGGSASANYYPGMMAMSMRGLLIGNHAAAYEDSDVVLDGKVTVCKPLATLLKEHQEEGLKFCWRNVCGQIMNFKREGDHDIHGAILAHNMGLGKSLQAVCLLHTLLTHPSLVTINAGGRIIYRAMLIAPVNTLANWETEFQKWVGTNPQRSVPAIRFYPWNDQKSKMKIVKEWHDYGGILCVSLDKYASACKGFLDSEGGRRGAANKKTAAKKSTASTENDAFLRKALFKPGPDIVVLDEVHSMLKSNNTRIYKAICGMGTRLRLGLTGSPIQNNLYEYYRMANYVRPGCLGSEANFTKKYHDPIMDGMAADCTLLQAERQEQVSKELHGILSEFVHRRDADVLAKELPFLQETIIHVRQSRVQGKLYKEFRKYQKENFDKSFFKQYHALRPVSNHPACLIYPEDKRTRSSTPISGEPNGEICGKTLDNRPRVAPDKYAWICDKCQKAKFRTLDEAEEHEMTCDGTFDPDSAPLASLHSSKGQGRKDSESEEWWKPFAERAEKSDIDIKAIEHGGKIVLLLQIIAHCDAIGDKVVVFSQSLPTLSFIEEVLNSSDWCGFKLFLPENTRKQNLGGWRRNQEYLRIDGSVDAKERGDLIDTFHSAGNQQSKLFLLSTNAGGLGINLTAANRVVIFDSHWNPAVDLQAVYRCYRYGQTKPVFCYRLLAEGSMEQKIYSRAAAKTSLSDLVIDQQNPERSFTRHELDLLRLEDTWVCCNACIKWRMLPPDISEEVVANLPDEWYCKDNIYDPDRSSCDAEERTGTWMVSFFEHRAREATGMQLQPQGSQGSQGEKVAVDGIPAFDQRHHEYTERDEVLQVLLERSEEKKTANTTGNDTSSGKMRWVSKWDFTFDKTEKFEPTAAEEKIAKSPIKRTKSPTKVKSPTGMSAVKRTKVKSEQKPNRRSPRKKTLRSVASSERKRRSSDKLDQEEEEEQLPDEKSSEEKKRKTNKVKAESKLPSAKKAKKEHGVVDLTFSDSDSG